MNLAQADAVPPQPRDGIPRLSKFYGKVAGIVIDSQVLGQPRVARMLASKLLEKTRWSPRVFEEANGSGSKPRCSLRPVRSESLAMCSTQRTRCHE